MAKKKCDCKDELEALEDRLVALIAKVDELEAELKSTMDRNHEDMIILTNVTRNRLAE